jgi:lactoylglutathione lyase
MLPPSLFAPLVLLAAHAVPSTACAFHAARAETSTNATYPIVTYGNDTAADAATTAWFTNHFALTVRDIDTSVDFYERVFGFRLVFTYQATAHYSFSYMAHASGGKNGTGYQTAAEMLREKNNGRGMLELISYNNPARPSGLTSSTTVPNTFSHFGVVVPDTAAALARFEELGVDVVYKPGDTLEIGGKVLNAFGLGSIPADDPEAQEIVTAFEAIAGGLLFITDPDDNLIEVYPQ